MRFFLGFKNPKKPRFYKTRFNSPDDGYIYDSVARVWRYRNLIITITITLPGLDCDSTNVLRTFDDPRYDRRPTCVWTA